jgi:hypothetical protein
VPFLPILLVWDILGRAASFGLGWATSRFFGQIPGEKGRTVSTASALALGWFVGLSAAAVPLVLGIALERAGALELAWWQLGRREAAIVLGTLIAVPPIVTLLGEVSMFHRDRSVRRWLTELPGSYPVALSLGAAVLLMVVFTPFVAVRRMLEGRRMLHIPILVRDGRVAELLADIEAWLQDLGYDVRRTPLTGPTSWPMRIIRYASARLLRSSAPGGPTVLRSGPLEVVISPTDVTVVAPDPDANKVRAAIHKRLALSQAFLTWSEESQRFEEELMAIQGRQDATLEDVTKAVGALQERIDAAHIQSDEWDVLYRLRLQVERDAYERSRKQAAQPRA